MDSFGSIKKWLVDVERFASPNVLKLIVGNKNDLAHKRAVDFSVAKVLLQCLFPSFYLFFYYYSVGVNGK